MTCVVSVRQQEGGLVVAIAGELDADSEDAVWSRLEPHLAAGCEWLDLEAQSLSFVDSRGFSVLVRLSRAIGDPARMVVRNPQPPVERALGLMGLDRLMTVE